MGKRTIYSAKQHALDVRCYRWSQELEAAIAVRRSAGKAQAKAERAIIRLLGEEKGQRFIRMAHATTDRKRMEIACGKA